MKPAILNWSSMDQRAKSAALARPPAAGSGLGPAVTDIIASVRRDGDGALFSFTRQFDQCELDRLDVPMAIYTSVPENNNKLIHNSHSPSQLLRVL